MGKEFTQVQADDFSKITPDRLPHQEIEMALISIGGGGVRGIDFKTEMVKAAGWNRERLSTYSGNPDLAAEAFNRIRELLAETEDAGELRSRLAEDA